MRARLGLVGVLMLAAAPTSSEPRVVEAILTCTATACTALIVDNVERVQLCVDRAKATPPPRLLDDKGTSLGMKRDGTRWCATVGVHARGVFVQGAARQPFSITVVSPALAAPAAHADTERWAKVADLEPELYDAVSDVQFSTGSSYVEDVFETLAEKQAADPLPNRVTLQPEVRSTKSIGGEPVSSPPVSPKVEVQPPAAPDDRSFVDVVGVGDKTGFHCSGILIRRDAILTAAHCVPATRIGIGNDVNRFVRTVAVTEAIVHPTLDVAVLRLAAEVSIVTREWRRRPETGVPRGVVRLVGFGVDDPRKAGGFGIKRRVDIPIEGWGCDRGRAANAGCTDGAELVVAGVAGRDTCWGDSGGPVLEASGSTFRLLAITSRPAARAGAPCGRGGIYVRADAISDWLMTTEEKRQ